MEPLYVYLDPRFHASPEFPSPQARALELLGEAYDFTVLWWDDALDGLYNLDEAIALAIAKAVELKRHVRVTVSRSVGRVAGDPWEDLTVFVVGPDKHRVQRARGRR